MSTSKHSRCRGHWLNLLIDRSTGVAPGQDPTPKGGQGGGGGSTNPRVVARNKVLPWRHGRRKLLFWDPLG